MGVSENGGTPKWMVKIMENPIKMDDVGGGNPLFLETSRVVVCKDVLLEPFTSKTWGKLNPFWTEEQIFQMAGSTSTWCLFLGGQVIQRLMGSREIWRKHSSSADFLH